MTSREDSQMSSQQPTLETKRLRLRPMRGDDHDAVADLLSDDQWVQHIGGARTRAGAWRVMAMIAGHWQLRGYGMWVLEHRESREFLGWCGLWYPDGWSCPEIGWTLTQQAAGHGYATEAALAARDYGFTVAKLPRLISYIASDNTASIRVANRMGAVQTGMESPDGDGVMVHVYEHQRP